MVCLESLDGRRCFFLQHYNIHQHQCHVCVMLLVQVLLYYTHVQVECYQVLATMVPSYKDINIK